MTVSSPCQGLSRASRDARGLGDPRSALIRDAWRILTLILRNQAVKPGFLFEMVDAMDHPKEPARQAFEVMGRLCCGGVENWVRIDAAKLGAAAHRVRVFGTNLAPAAELKRQ